MRFQKISYSTALLLATMILMLTSIAGASPFAYITNCEGNNTSVIDIATNSVIATIPNLNNAWGVAVSHSGTIAYVTDRYGDNVSVIDTRNNTVTATIKVGNEPIGIAINPTDTRVYVANIASDNVSVIDTATNNVIATVPVGTEPSGVVVTPDGKRVYVTSYNSGSISVIDTATNTVIDTVDVGFGSYGIAVTSDSAKVYVSNSDNDTGTNVSVIDTATNTIKGTVLVGNNPSGIAVTPDGKEVYVANFDDGTVSVIDTITNFVKATVPVGSYPEGVAITPDGKTVYVANAGSDNVSVIDAATNTVKTSVPVGNWPVAFGQFIATSPTPTPTLTLVKSASPTTYSVVGENITYNYTINNSGNVNILGPFSITDSKIGTFTVSNGALTPGQSVIGTANYTITQADLDNGFVTNEAFAKGTFNGTEVTSPHVTKTVTVQSPRPIAVNAYITNCEGNNTSVIDIATNNVVATVPNLNNAWGIAVSHSGTTAYVTDRYGDNVSVIDTKNNTVTATIKVGNEPIGVAINPTDTRVYVTNIASDNVSVIDTTTNTVTTTVPVGTEPSGVVVTPDGKRVYVASYNSGSISVIDTATNTVTHTLDIGAGSYGIAVTSDSAKVYVSNSDNDTGNNVSIIDTATNTITARVLVGNNPSGIAVTPDGKEVYVANFDDGTVSMIDTVTNIVKATVPVGSYPEGVAVTPDGKTVYVANAGSDNVSVIDIATNTIKTSVPVGNWPIAFGQFIATRPTLTPALTLVKSASPKTYSNVGDKITYTYNVTNIGNVNIAGPITVTDNRTGIINITAGNLAPGKSANGTANYTITQEDLDNGSVANEAFAKGTFNGTDVNATSTEVHSTNVIETVTTDQGHEDEYPAYCISKSIIAVDEEGDCIINEAGDIIKYRIVVKNEGNVDLTDVSVQDDLIELEGPKGDEIEPGVLNVGETWKFYGEYEVTEEDIENDGNAEDGYIENTATVSCNELPDKKCTEKEPILQKTDLCIYKSVIGTDEDGDCIINEPGDIIQYQVIVKNEGKVDLTGIEVEDSLIELEGPELDDTDQIDKDRLHSGRIKPGEVWKYIGEYEVTEEDIEENGNGDEEGYIENTATVSCNELPDKTSTAKQQIFLKQIKDNGNSQDNGNNQDNGNQNNNGGNQNNNNGNNNQNSGNNQNNNNQNNNQNNGNQNNNGNNVNTGGSSHRSSSSSSKGGSSGLTTSPEAAKNIETKESSQAYITNGKNTKFDFVNKNTCVIQITFDAKKTLGKTKATVEMLKGKSSLVSEMPAEQVYECLNIWIGNNGVVNSQSIENAQISFRVEKQWIKDKNIDQDTITLQRYNNGKWEKLQTTLSEEDDKYLGFTAKTPGFSPFVITAKTLDQKTQDEDEKENNINIEPKEKDSGQNEGNVNSNTKENTEKEQKQTQKSPGFEILTTVAAILTVLIHKEKKK